jgi:hypothetical protein
MTVKIGDKVRSATTVAKVVKIEEKDGVVRRVVVLERDSGERRWMSVLDFKAEYRTEAEHEAAKKLAQREAA